MTTQSYAVTGCVTIDQARDTPSISHVEAALECDQPHTPSSADARRQTVDEARPLVGQVGATAGT
jgi:hypothetical protein